MKNPSKRRGVLGVVLALYISLGVLLTPAGGLETRPFSDVTILGLVSIGLGSVGLLAGVAALILVLLKPKRAPLPGIVGAVLNVPAIFVDQIGAFHSVYSPSVTITLLERVQLFVVTAVVIWALVSREAGRTGRQLF